ncbi:MULTISPECIES: hypothetical protein [Methylotenera]|uniref:hypothetical protein n=1 Tax=Methylotenera TaxID=359407 RepID=UPI000360D944|nr:MULTISPECIES: hypothetical protein [Methylotenera]
MDQPYKPSEYLRERRPERYSDSITLQEPQLTKDLLEYHLETLTNRGQDKEFEHFARRLAEKELCPNLLPQTGPTGGGDSKVDTETYPVAEEISLRWYTGTASADNRWAFAISAKKDWRAKVKSDVKKIAETDRGYKLIYFITNQFVRDKSRAEVEDLLKVEFGIELRILDRSWIVDRVINHDNIDIAAQTLSIGSLQLTSLKKIGPNDAQREIELTDLDKNIKDHDRYTGIAYQLAEDCHQAAVIASELERDRNEVIGRFASALRIAEKVGDKRQILRITYRQAWVTCFVYDDLEEMSRLYDKVEELALSSTFAEDVELANNLWNVLVANFKLGLCQDKYYKIDERRNSLRASLESLSSEEHRPNNALHAKTMLSFHKLLDAQHQGSDISKFEPYFDELNQIFQNSKGLGLYPFDAFKKVIYELGEIFANSAAYDKLLDTVVEIEQERTSEGSAGRAITNRGIQKFKAGLIYESIKLFGQAQEKLIKEEYQDDLVKCLIACGGTYKAAGLNWAARTSLLAALSICISEHHASGSMHDLALLAAKELSWIEVKLGRVPHVLFSFMLVAYIANHTDLEDEKKKSYEDFIQHIDGVFSILLLSTNLDQLKDLEKIPHVLDQLHLFCSEATLVFALGDLEALINDLKFEDSEEKIEQFFNLLYSQPAREDLPLVPELCNGEILSLKSDVLGMSLIMQVDANEISILIAESLLGSLEAFLATSLEGFFPYKQDPRIIVRVSKDIKESFGIKFNTENQNCVMEVLHRPDFEINSAETIFKFREFITDFIATLLPNVLLVNDENHIERLVKEEKIFCRSFTFSDVMTLSKNIFGSLDWLEISKLSDSIKQDGYKLKRQTSWQPIAQEKKPQEPLTPGEGEVPDDIKNVHNFKHGERKVFSLIDIPVWDKAKWSGIFFMVYPEGQFPPCIGLIFKNEEAARQIFTQWRSKLSDKDIKEEISINIITGVDKNFPPHYRLRVGTNLNAYESRGERGQFMAVSRIQTMTPDTHENLSRFLNAYKSFNIFCLIPAVFILGSSEPKVIRDLFIFKKALTIKPAWQIGENDEDSCVLQLDDDPIIPAGETAPPVLKALERRRRFQSQK